MMLMMITMWQKRTDGEKITKIVLLHIQVHEYKFLLHTIITIEQCVYASASLLLPTIVEIGVWCAHKHNAPREPLLLQ